MWQLCLCADYILTQSYEITSAQTIPTPRILGTFSPNLNQSQVSGFPLVLSSSILFFKTGEHANYRKHNNFFKCQPPVFTILIHYKHSYTLHCQQAIEEQTTRNHSSPSVESGDDIQLSG